jgi:signal peptidase I
VIVALLAVAAVASAGALAFGALRWQYSVVTVHGPSMAPELSDGDRVLVRRCGVRRLRTGELVIFREPGRLRRPRRPAWLTGANQDLWVIKRVAATPGDPVPEAVRPVTNGATVVPRGSLVVFGDAPGSRDSRSWGFVPASAVLGISRRKL